MSSAPVSYVTPQRLSRPAGMWSAIGTATMAVLAWGALQGIGNRVRGRADREMEIRPLAAGDLADVCHFAAAPVARLQALLLSQQAGTTTCLVAWLRRQPVGMATICWDGPREPAVQALFPACPEVHSVEVDSTQRSAGIGSRLLAVCEGMAIGRGFDRIGLAVAIDNVHAYALYLRSGYAEPQRIEFEPTAPNPAPADAGGGRPLRWRFLVKAL